MRFITFFIPIFWVGSALAAPPVSVAKAHFLRGDYAQAARAAEQLLAQSGGKSGRGMDEAHYLAGVSYLKGGKHVLAREHFNAILKDFSSSTFKEEANVGLADVLYVQGDYKAAGSLYESMARKSAYRDFRPALYGRLRLVCLKTGDTDQAEKYARKLSKLYPLSPEGRDSGGSASSPAAETMTGVLAMTGEKRSGLPPGVGSAREVRQGAYFVQVGAFGSKANAESLKNKLIAQGYTVHIAESASGENKSYKVRVGKEDTRGSAEVLKRELSSQGYPTTICQ